MRLVCKGMRDIMDARHACTMGAFLSGEEQRPGRQGGCVGARRVARWAPGLRSLSATFVYPEALRALRDVPLPQLVSLDLRQWPAWAFPGGSHDRPGVTAVSAVRM
jgi:hypothetical protein